jgi:3-methyladenine DNA glycosylase AlkD
MDKAEALKQLKGLGTAQNRKIYARHGVTGEQFGVSYANLGKLKKQIKTDQGLAEALWATGNHDARVLATMIADPAQMTAAKLSGWARELDDDVLGCALAKLAAQSPGAHTCLTKWIAAKREWTASAGWDLLAHLAMKDMTLTDATLGEYIETIEARIHTSQNRVKHSMNGALIAIGVRNPKLQKLAIAAAKRIGKVEVDHGETDCKTPDAVAYIKKTMSHRRKKGKQSLVS